MNNFPTLENRVSEYCSGLSEDRMVIKEFLKRKKIAEQEIALCNKNIQELLTQIQRDNDNCAGLDILAKVKQGKYVIVDLETSQPVQINFV